jgi:hypothetical protein
MKAYEWSRAIAPLILNIGKRWRWVVTFIPRSLYPQKQSRCPLNRKLCGPQSRSQNMLKRKTFFHWVRTSRLAIYYTDYVIATSMTLEKNVSFLVNSVNSLNCNKLILMLRQMRESLEDFWFTKWHRDKFSSQYFYFPDDHRSFNAPNSFITNLELWRRP